MPIFDLSFSFWNLLPSAIVALFFLGLIVSSLGFFRVVWFISIGYGYSVAAMSVLIITLVPLALMNNLGFVLLLFHALLLVIYGLRLGTFLVIRDTKKTYNAEVQESKKIDIRLKFPVKIAIWITVSALYAVMVTPVLFHAGSFVLDPVMADQGVVIVTIAGLFISLLGIVMESVADFQKSRFKTLNPKRFCDTGLFRLVRFPNYFGEILVWIGSFVAGIPYYANALQWILASSGTLVIALIMMGSAKRLELKQEARYDKDSKFQAYAKTVPALFPFIPLYSLKKIKIAIDW